MKNIKKMNTKVLRESKLDLTKNKYNLNELFKNMDLFTVNSFTYITNRNKRYAK